MMKKITDSELNTIFENRSNCYADSDEVVMAMDKEKFIEVINELKLLSRIKIDNQRELLSNFSSFISDYYELNINIDDYDVDQYIKSYGV